MENDASFLDEILIRTLRFSSGNTTMAVGEPHDLKSAQIHLFTALGSTKEVIEQAKEAVAVSDRSLDQVEEGDAFQKNNEFHPPGRRQGLALNRKRARFSMKPITSQHSMDTDVDLKINHDQIRDPNEYFAAVEKIEIAGKEIKKLKAQVSTELTEDHIYRIPRHHRPGLLRKRSAKHFSLAPTDKMENFTLSAEDRYRRHSNLFMSSTENKFSDPAEKNNRPITSQENGRTDFQISDAPENEGFAFGKENQNTNLLDTLLSSFKDLDDDNEGIALLQEHLQLKQIDIDKILLPVTPNIHTTPSIKKSPLAAISSLQKQTFQRDRSVDPYTFHSDDTSCSGSPSISSNNRVTDADTHHDVIIQPDIPISNRDGVIASFSGNQSSLEGTFASKNTVTTAENDTSKQSKERDRISASPDSHGVSEIVPDKCPRDAEDSISYRADGNDGLDYVGFDCLPNEKGDCVPPEASICKQLDLDSEGVYSGTGQTEREGSAGSPNRNWEFMCAFDAGSVRVVDFSEGKVDAVPHVETEQQDLEVRSSLAEETATIDGRPGSSGILAKQHNEEHQPSEKIPKGNVARQQKRKIFSGRKSLAGAGTKWESGIRRSTRIKFRPLEYWRGERLLYGRVHESLTTVVGVKQLSPGGNGLKVKSYVSEEFAEFVDKVARY